MTDTGYPAIIDGPCSIDVAWEDGTPRQVIFSTGAWYADDQSCIFADDGITVHTIPLDGPPELDEPGHFIAANTNHDRLEVRAVDPGDAMMGYGLRVGYPLPVDVLKNLIIEGPKTMPDLEAVVDGKGWVVTLILVTDIGTYARFSNAWQRVNDPAEFLDNVTVVDVDDSAVSLWDKVDSGGKTMAAVSLPLAEGQQTPDAPTDVPMEAITAAAEVLVEAELLVAPINTEDDLPAAIESAVLHPEARWYVERRVQALGVADRYPLPW